MFLFVHGTIQRSFLAGDHHVTVCDAVTLAMLVRHALIHVLLVAITREFSAPECLVSLVFHPILHHTCRQAEHAAHDLC